jgi:flagellin FlaB
MISFVVVASVFAYTVLSAGIFSAEKGKQAISDGLERTGNSMQLIGPIIGRDTNGDDNLDQIVFIVSPALGGNGINFTPTTDSDSDGLLSDESNASHNTVIAYYDDSQEVSDLAWTTSELGMGDGDNILDHNEKFEVTVNVTGLSPRLQANQTFIMEVRLQGGATLIFERSTGAVIDSVTELN